jgi:hypothetical protein
MGKYYLILNSYSRRTWWTILFQTLLTGPRPINFLAALLPVEIFLGMVKIYRNYLSDRYGIHWVKSLDQVFTPDLIPVDRSERLSGFQKRLIILSVKN